MSEVGDVHEYEGFEWVCTVVDGLTSTWVRKDHLRHPVGVGYEVID